MSEESLVRTTRDDAQLRVALQRFLVEQLPGGAGPEVSELRSPSGSGMSSETLLFDAHWTEDGVRQGGPFVARMAPASA